jgi:hypothetical protein
MFQGEARAPSWDVVVCCGVGQLILGLSSADCCCAFARADYTRERRCAAKRSPYWTGEDEEDKHFDDDGEFDPASGVHLSPLCTERDAVFSAVPCEADRRVCVVCKPENPFITPPREPMFPWAQAAIFGQLSSLLTQGFRVCNCNCSLRDQDGVSLIGHRRPRGTFWSFRPPSPSAWRNR